VRIFFIPVIALVYFLISPAHSLTNVAFSSCKTPTGELAQATRARLEKKILSGVLAYAFEHAHPTTGFVLDTVNNYDDTLHSEHLRASISSTGFMMALVASSYLKGMTDREKAYSYCKRPIVAVIEREKSDSERARQRRISGEPDPQTDISFRGWWSHFIDWSNGDRWGNSEYALTDSTWMLAGMLVCAETFPETDLPKMVKKLYSQVDYQAMMTDGGVIPDKRTLSLSYTPCPGSSTPPEGHKKKKTYGYSPLQWDIYQHSWLVYLLGLGSPNEKLKLPSASWAAWRRTGTLLSPTSVDEPDLAGQFLYGDHRALFSHYFPDLFMPPKKLEERCKINYFENSKLATHFNRFSALSDSTSKTFVSGLWGLDAGPNPDVSELDKTDVITVGTPATEIYGVNTPYKRNGTACLSCAVAAAMFDPDLIFSTLKQWCDNEQYGDKIWGKYGPANGINLDYGWISPHALSGIVGPMALSIANLDWETSVWKKFAQNEEVARAIKVAKNAEKPTTSDGSDPCRQSEGHRNNKNLH
jgi:hypothetical protein